MSNELRQRLFKYETNAHATRIDALGEAGYEQKMHKLLDVTEKQVKDLFLQLIGEDEAYHGEYEDQCSQESRNELRAELRKKVEEL